MTTVTLNPMTTPSRQLLMEAALRRRLNAELLEIRNQITRFGTNDELSQIIHQWEINFTAALRTNADLEPIFQEYIRLLQEILFDPHNPLDEQALLGSDGRTYGYKLLCIYYNSVPEIYRDRSPLDPENDAPFTTVPHETARFLIEWLERHDEKLESENIQRSFSNLTHEQLKNIIPNERNNRIRRIRRLHAEREQVNQQFTKQLNEARHVFSQQAEMTYQPVRERIDRFAQQTFQRFDEVEENDQNELEQLQNMSEQFREEFQEIENEYQQLKENIQENGNLISEAKKDDLQIRLQITEVKKAINKKKRDFANLCIAAVSIVGLAFGTWALNGIIGSSTLSVIITPIKGGAKVGVSLLI